jgi:hypothetical protein
MRMAYVDESGDSGYAGSRTYTLGCVMVHDIAWPDVFDDYLQFRRFIRTQFGILVRDEIKANYLLRGSGPLKRLGLGETMRHDIYRQHMRLAPKLGLDVFAVVIEKTLIAKTSMNPRDIAWEYLLQRLERMSSTDQEPVMVIHDEGDPLKIRALARKARRANMPGSAFGTGYFRLPARLLIDDPVSRNSQQSFFIQLADMAAYAAYRRLHPAGKTPSICPATMWDELGAARYAEANKVAMGQGWSRHPGIVVWPHSSLP